jgi:Golgi nucleoside diphosphatase
MRRFGSSSQSLTAQGGAMLSSSKAGTGYEPLGAASKRAASSRQVLVKGAAALLVSILAVVGVRAALTPADRVYGLMIDAGSTGSRMHTFEFSRDGAGKLTLLTEDFFPTKPGLSAYKDDPSAAGASLEPLLERARKVVPKAEHARTVVFLRATAGLRMTGEEKAAAILANVHERLGKSGFRFDSPGWATILGGPDEGIYSWITVNSLLDRSPEDTVGTLEMGGGSAQVSFVPIDEPRPAAGNCSIPADATLFKGENLPLYTFSNLKFGLKMGRAAALRHFRDAGMLSGNPCVNAGAGGGGISVAIPFDENGRTVNISGAGDYAACRALVDDAVTKPAYQTCKCDACTYFGIAAPKPIAEFYALAFYLERTVALGMSTPLTLADIRAKGEEVCGLSTARVRRAYPSVPNGEATDLCLDLAFIASHLEWGHGIKESAGTKLHIVDKIKGVELGWSLGAMVAELGRLKIGH